MMGTTKPKEDTDQIHMCKELFITVNDVSSLKINSEQQEKEVTELKDDIKLIRIDINGLRNDVNLSTLEVSKYANRIIIWVVGSLFTLSALVITIIKL